MTDLEKRYLQLPIFLQNLVCSLQGWQIQHQRFGKQFPTLLAEVEKRTFWTKEAIITYRHQALAAFVQHAYNTAPYYRTLFQEKGISPQAIRTLEDLQTLPILNKHKVQDHYPALVSTAIPVKDRLITHTSGTTGGGLRFATTALATQAQWAFWWRYRHWHGLGMGTWCGYFGGRSVVPLQQKKPPFWRYNYSGRQILFSAYHINPETIPLYVQELRAKRPPWLHGYPSVLSLLASYLLEKRMTIGYQLRWITVGAENLLPLQKKMIEQAFGVSPRQHYGMAEAVANISECELGRLHVDEDFSAVEFIPNEYGEGYRVVGTNFTNPATPLLRYEVQDVVDLVEGEDCPCGRPGRLVKRIDGRQEDYVVLANGSRLGRMDHIFKDLVHIREAQIYQCLAGELVLRVVRGEGYTEQDEQLLRQETGKRVGQDTVVKVDYVNSLPRSATGKLRFVVSEIREAQIAQNGQGVEDVR